MNTKTCPTCNVRVLPTGDETCPGCGTHLADVPSDGTAAQETHAVAAPSSATTSTVTIERLEIKRPSYQIPCAWKWTVFLNGKPVGELPEKARIRVPIGLGTFTVSFSLRVMGDYQQVLSIPVTGPDDFDMLFRVAEEYGAFKRKIYVADKIRLPPEKRQPVPATPAPEVAKLPPSETTGGVPTAMADVTGGYTPPARFKFTEIFWQKTAILFGFYWLFRWLFPSILPSSLRELDFKMTLIPCAILGLIWTGISFLMRLGAKPEQKSKPTGGQNA